MLYYASKVFGFFAIPSNFVILVGITGALLLRTRFSRWGWRLTVGSLVLLAVIGLSPVGNALIVPLEERFPPWDHGRGAPHGMVVLGGALSPDVSHARDTVALNEAAERLTTVAELARRYPDARIIFSGGSGAVLFAERPEAEFALRLLERLGVPRGRVIAEDKSRNTVENARFSRELAQPKPGERWVLVTSAYHLPRAIGIFRKAGFPVEAYPVDWRTRGTGDVLRPFPTLGEGLRRTDTAMREWIGLLAYWIGGQSSELFPGPVRGAEM
ncbi:MAG: YdcF family protein [Xanthobacteraceae bacterium]|nr:YdcF family protein [Xanthobacteraceae bacterium]